MLNNSNKANNSFLNVPNNKGNTNTKNNKTYNKINTDNYDIVILEEKDLSLDTTNFIKSLVNGLNILSKYDKLPESVDLMVQNIKSRNILKLIEFLIKNKEIKSIVENLNFDLVEKFTDTDNIVKLVKFINDFLVE